MNLLSKVEFFDVAAFVNWQVWEAYDLERLGDLHLTHTEESGRYYGWCEGDGYHYEIICGISPHLSYPLTEWYRVGWLRWHRETYADAQELMVSLAAHEFYHYLHATGQVDGPDTEWAANAYAQGWLEEWRDAH